MSVTTLRGPQDLIANLPSLIGFIPSESLVVVVLAHRTPFCTIRFDLATPPEQIDEVLVPMIAQERDIDGLIFVNYSDVAPTRHPVERTWGAMVRDVLWVSNGRWRSWLCQEGCCPEQDVPDYSDSALAVAIQPLQSRESLAQSLQYVGGQDAGFVEASHTVRGTEHATVLAALTSGDARLVTPEIVATLRAICQHDEAMQPLPLNRRDALMVDLRAGLEPGMVGVIARQVPDADSYTLGLLSMLAWLGGDGASSLILADRAGDNNLAKLTQQANVSGCNPRDFSESLVGLV